MNALAFVSTPLNCNFSLFSTVYNKCKRDLTGRWFCVLDSRTEDPTNNFLDSIHIISVLNKEYKFSHAF